MKLPAFSFADERTVNRLFKTSNGSTAGKIPVLFNNPLVEDEEKSPPPLMKVHFTDAPHSGSPLPPFE